MRQAESFTASIAVAVEEQAAATNEIARAHGARVVPFAWDDDFAAGRNFVLGHLDGAAVRAPMDGVITGAVRDEQTRAAILEALKATFGGKVTLHVGPKRPSAVLLPIIPPK